MKRKIHSSSRRKTPWDFFEELTPSQNYIKSEYLTHYQQRHPSMCGSHEAELLNSYHLESCPICSSSSIHKDGKTKNGIQRYRCKDCGARFTITTATIFEDHKLPIGEWIEYCLNLFHHVSLSNDSRNNKNAMNTSVYWLHKLFLIFKNYQDTITLQGTIYLDETYYTVAAKDVKRKHNGQKLRGISRNKYCIATAYDGKNTICILCGKGKPSGSRIKKVFLSHIMPGSLLIHDGENSHTELIESLGLKSEIHTTAETHDCKDEDNPLAPINHIHFLLKHFLRSHSSFKREDFQGYLDLFAFIINPPDNQLEKVDILLNLSLKSNDSLRYREYFRIK